MVAWLICRMLAGGGATGEGDSLGVSVGDANSVVGMTGVSAGEGDAAADTWAKFRLAWI